MRAVLAILAILPVFAADGPQVEKVTPLGGQRGTEVRVEFTGTGLMNINSAEFDSQDLTWKSTAPATPYKITGVISIGATAALGPHVVRLRGMDGESGSFLFNVGQFPARAEIEPNDTREQAQLLSGLPIELYGELQNRSESDFYAFDAKAGERLVFDLRTMEHGSYLECKMRLLDASGRQVAFSDDRTDFDDSPYLERRFDQTGRYYLQVDQYHGPRAASAKNSTYIVRISSLPTISYSSNLGGQTGSVLRMRLTGQELHSLDRIYLTRARLAEHFRFTYPHTIPVDIRPDPATGDAVERITGKVASQSPDHCDVEFAIPASASIGMWRLWAGTRQGVIEGGFLEVSRSREVGESAVAAVNEAPLVISGALRQRNERDRFVFSVRAGQGLHFHVQAAQLGAPSLDSVLELRDEQGKLLAANDDLVTGAASFGNPDSSLFFTAPADGKVQLTIRDRLGRGGPEYAYRMHAELRKPSFQLWTLPENLTAERGGSVDLAVRMAREEGFDKEEVEVWAEGLPPGVTVEPAKFRADQAWELGGDGLQMTTPELVMKIHVPASLSAGTYALRVKGAAAREKDDPARRVVDAQANLLRGPLTNLFNFVRRPLPGIRLTVVEPWPVHLKLSVPTISLQEGVAQMVEVLLSSVPDTIPVEWLGLSADVKSELISRDRDRAVFRFTGQQARPAPVNKSLRLAPAVKVDGRWAVGSDLEVTLLRPRS